MKATEQYFPVVLFIMLYKVALSFESVDEILKSSLTIQMKATEQYFPVVLFIMLYKVVLTFKSVTEIFQYVTTQINVADKFFPCGVVCCAAQGSFDHTIKILKYYHSNDSYCACAGVKQFRQSINITLTPQQDPQQLSWASQYHQ